MDNETGLADVHDRVAEAYRGDLGPNFMRKTQARIHWICRRVAGARILDIGASQGITAILLAREGKRVDAVDFDPKAIEAARRYVEGESELVRERIQLTEADALTHPFEPGAYDTVVLGEVLEHLLQPRAMVEVAAAALRPGGRLVVTLPFGVNDFFDHKKTYYLHSAASLLHAHFEIDEIEIVETWIALTGTVRAEPVETAPELSGALLERAEAAIEAAERNYLQRVRSLTQQIEKAKESAQTLQRDLSQARKNASTATEASKASAADLARLEESSQTLRSKAERLEGELEAIRGEASELRLKLGLSEQTVGFVSDLLKGLETDHLPGIARPAGSPEGEDEARPIALRLQDLVLALRLSWDEVRKAQERAETLDAALTERDAQMAAAQKRERELDDDRTRLEAERASLEETVEHLAKRVSSLDAALNEALTETASTIEREGELADRCAQLEAERARLEEEIAQLTARASSLDVGLNEALEDKKRTAAQLDEARKAAAASKDEKTRANAGEAKLKQLETKVSQLERARKEAVMAAEAERESSLRHIASLEAANSRLAFDKEKARSSRSFRLGNALVVFAKRPRISGIPQLLRSLRAATRPVVLPQLGATAAERRAPAGMLPQQVPVAKVEQRVRPKIVLPLGSPKPQEKKVAAPATPIKRRPPVVSPPEDAIPEGDRAFLESKPLSEVLAEINAMDDAELLRERFWTARKNDQVTAYAAAYRRFGEISGSRDGPKDADLSEMKKKLPDEIALLDLIPKAPSISALTTGNPSIAYFLHNSLPYASGGYATRAHGLAQGLRSQGVQIDLVTRPGFPLDQKKDIERGEVPLIFTIDEVDYRRILDPMRGIYRNVEYLKRAADAVEDYLRSGGYSLAVAASNYYTGLPVLIAARRVGIPFIYEVRGFWEITRASREPAFSKTVAYKVQEYMEAEVCRRADAVLTLTAGMKGELGSRGVADSLISLLPNSCDPSAFEARPSSSRLKEALGIPEQAVVIGYIGSFVQYEGLENLASACGVLKKRGIEFRLLIVGNENVVDASLGPIAKAILEEAETNGFGDWLIMPGRVPHDEVPEYYSIIDIAPFPRKPQPVTEIVSPMKPLEAMCMEKAVVVSSVGAMAEMVVDGQTGLIFEKGNIADLADKLQMLIDNPKLRANLGTSARVWVEKNRTWSQTASKMHEVISSVMARG